MIRRWLALTYYLYALRLAALSHFILIDYMFAGRLLAARASHVPKQPENAWATSVHATSLKRPAAKQKQGSLKTGYLGFQAALFPKLAIIRSRFRLPSGRNAWAAVPTLPYLDVLQKQRMTFKPCRHARKQTHATPIPVRWALAAHASSRKAGVSGMVSGCLTPSNSAPHGRTRARQNKCPPPRPACCVADGRAASCGCRNCA